MKYDHQQIETKWQKYWQEQQRSKRQMIIKAQILCSGYVSLSFGSGTSCRPCQGYTATDIVARYKRAKGFNVLHPMGWDSFGLPAEQYAIRTGTHPAITTEQNIDTFRRQLESLGFSYDWDREIATSDPSYYKWTQWIFTKLYEKGLAYEAEMHGQLLPCLGHCFGK